jgi:hypothetical protein
LEWSFKYSKNIMVSSKLWYSKRLAKHLSEKNIMVFFHTSILWKNFTNILFPNIPLLSDGRCLPERGEDLSRRD